MNWGYSLQNGLVRFLVTYMDENDVQSNIVDIIKHKIPTWYEKKIKDCIDTQN